MNRIDEPETRTSLERLNRAFDAALTDD
jgi:hypothetical protein